MRGLSKLAQSYIIAVWLIGGVIYYWLIWVRGVTLNLELPLLCALAAITQVLRVRGTTNRSSYELSWVVWGFTFVIFGAPATLLTITIAYIAEFIWHKQPWFISIFNIASFAITLLLAEKTITLLSGDAHTWNWISMLGILAGLAVFTSVNHLLIGVVIWLARGENLQKSGVLSRLTLSLDFSMIGLGAAGALMWSINPIAVVFVITPLYVIYVTMRVPALEQRAKIDIKTGLLNLEHFNLALEKEWELSNRFNRPITVVMADLDLLRDVNNTYGHLAGDAVLIGVASVLKDAVGDFDVVARFGGEEFALLMSNTSLEQALVRVEMLRRKIEMAEFDVNTAPNPIKVTMSFGVAMRDDKKTTARELVHAADLAVNHAKIVGRNSVCYYDSDQLKKRVNDNIGYATSPISIPKHENVTA
jgi:diguanylate cyclase (GGDEF)-like protein